MHQRPVRHQRLPLGGNKLRIWYWSEKAGRVAWHLAPAGGTSYYFSFYCIRLQVLLVITQESRMGEVQEFRSAVILYLMKSIRYVMTVIFFFASRCS